MCCIAHTADMHTKGRERPAELRSRERLVDYNRGRSRPFRVFPLTSQIAKYLVSRHLRKQELTTALTQELTHLRLATLRLGNQPNHELSLNFDVPAVQYFLRCTS